MAELHEIPLELQLREANRRIATPPQQRAQVHRVLVTHVPEKISSYYGWPPYRGLGYHLGHLR